MNGSKGYQASDASEKPEVVLSLRMVQRMLPLVQRIVDDILTRQRNLSRLLPEESRLDRERRQLDWPARQRRYRLKEEVAGVEHDLQGAKDELGELGVTLLDCERGRVGFPTMVNNRRAYFSWQPGDESLHSWHFAEECTCRPIPQAWLREISLSNKS